jgi:hypothetical protein
VNILNNQSWAADKGVVGSPASQLDMRQHLALKKIELVMKCHKGPWTWLGLYEWSELRGMQ